MGRRARAIGPFVVLAAGPVVVSGSTPEHAIEGLLATFVALAMVVPLVAVGVRPGRARPGSLVGGADRRRPWLIAFASTLFMSLLRFDSPTPAVRAAMLGAAAAIAVGLAVDVRALVRLRRAMAGAERLRPRTAESPPIDGRTAIYDFGVGDSEREELAPAAAVYRERERVVRVVRGSRAAAERALFYWIAFDIAVALPTLLTTRGRGRSSDNHASEVVNVRLPRVVVVAGGVTAAVLASQSRATWSNSPDVGPRIRNGMMHWSETWGGTVPEVACSSPSRGRARHVFFGINVTLDGTLLDVSTRAQMTSAALSVTGAEVYSRTFDISSAIRSGQVQFRYIPGVQTGELTIALDAMFPPQTHECNGNCFDDTSVNSCGTSCTPCPVPANATIATCASGSCDFVCKNGYRKCGSTCIPTTGCCVTADCPQPANGTATCGANNMCVTMCNTTYKPCGWRVSPRLDVARRRTANSRRTARRRATAATSVSTCAIPLDIRCALVLASTRRATSTIAEAAGSTARARAVCRAAQWFFIRTDSCGYLRRRDERLLDKRVFEYRRSDENPGGRGNSYAGCV